MAEQQSSAPAPEPKLEPKAAEAEAESEFPTLVKGNFARKPTTAAAYHQLVWDGWKPQESDPKKK